jgi:hypothetical protein
MFFWREWDWWQCQRIALLLTVYGGTLGFFREGKATADAIGQAKQSWALVGIRDYDLEWTVTGPKNAHYYLTVRGGEVRKLEPLQSEGHRLELSPPSPGCFSVDGLFLTIANEIALMKIDGPFNQAKRTKVVMWFESDPVLGFPHLHRRDVMGRLQAITIDVLKFVPIRQPQRNQIISSRMNYRPKFACRSHHLQHRTCAGVLGTSRNC